MPRRKPLLLFHEGGELEVWVHRVGADTQGAPDLYLLEFPGTASRAEHCTDFVEDSWSQRCAEIWAVNPPGYGNSRGTASLQKLPAAAERALKAIRQVAGETPVIVAGGSLGSVSSLYLAAHFRVEGVMMQNPPALRELIAAQSAWWHFNWLTRGIAAQIPPELDSISNAQQASAPAIFVSAQEDRVVPADIQRQIMTDYNGPMKVLSMPNADHASSLTESDLEELRDMTHWLYELMTQDVGHRPD